jgi:hypothetical protein
MLETRDESRALLAFAVAVFVFHQLPSLVGDWIDLLTPFVVIGAAALLIGRRAGTLVLVVAIVGALLYVDGHGIHLAANSINNEDPTGDAKDVAHFWDEEWGHFEWHLGWFVLIAALALAERARVIRIRRWEAVVSAVLLGWTFFVSTVEGGSWWLELIAAAVFIPWALKVRSPILVTAAAGFALAALMIGIWAVWQQGMPQFSDVGWI